MQDFAAVDELLRTRHRVELEEALAEGCFAGRLPAALTGHARVIPRLIQASRDEDGGITQAYEGIFVIDEVWYRFRCQLFADLGGARFLTEIAEFTAIEWQSRIALSA